MTATMTSGLIFYSGAAIALYIFWKLNSVTYWMFSLMMLIGKPLLGLSLLALGVVFELKNAR